MRTTPSGGLTATLRRCTGALILPLLLAVPAAHAELQIEVTSGVRDPVPVAIVPFARAVPGDGGLDPRQLK